ncbi:MAG: peptide chain release factor N(5)-glutamine methyltransferase [Candidatus Dormibacteraeota bacterium]|nr:peptide chain release factor N(5)-glutamine methyltransferase [Candidatus Dormibacteraeota bacterium]
MSRIASRSADSRPSSVGADAETLLRDAEQRIAASRNIEHWQPGLARWDALVMLAHVLGESPDGVDHQEVTHAQERRFESMVDRRLTGEPVNYITGHFEFCGLHLMVRSGVFSPRSSSEHLVDEAVTRLRRRRGHRVAVDVATGSGAIALAIAVATRDCEAWGLDISADAIRLARDNARHLDLGAVRFRVSDMLTSLPASLRGEVGVFTIHPPYVARAEVKTLPAEIRRFEPRSTLTDGSEDGLGLVRRLAADALPWLRPGGWVLVEIAPYLARATSTILRRAGLRDVRSQRDSLGVTRVVGGRL